MGAFFRNSIFAGAALTLASYEIGQIIRKKYRSALFHPLFLASVIVILILKIFQIEYEDYFRRARYISFYLTPATVCLALPLYDQLHLLKRNARAAAAGIMSGTLTSFLSVYLLARWFRLSRQEYATLLPKSITTAIGIEISEELGGIISVTTAVILMSGIFGSLMAEFIFKICKIEDPIARGIALGTASHAVGTAKAMESGGEEGAMGSFAIVASGLVSVLLAPVFVKLF